MELNMGNNKTLFQIEKEINDFLLNDNNFLEAKKSSENVKGMTKDRVNSVVEYVNKFISNNVDKSIRICPDGFFHNKQYVPIQTVYMLPDGTEEGKKIGNLFAFSQNVDVNTRIWWESVVLYVRFDEKYLYKDAYPTYSYPSTIYKMNIIEDLHKIFKKEAKEKKIGECESNIHSMQSEIKCRKREIEKIKEKIVSEEKKKEEILKWRFF